MPLLVKIMVHHLARKDSESGIVTYVVAHSEREVFEWMASDPSLNDPAAVNPERHLFTGFEDRRDAEYTLYDKHTYQEIGIEPGLDRMLRYRGRMYDELAVEQEYDMDGATLYGWSVHDPKVSKEDAASLIRLGVAIDIRGYLRD